MSLDGKTATVTGESKWITGEEARADVHQYRHTHDAILVGVNTVIADNPHLTTRILTGQNPIRVILDTHLRTPPSSHVITDGLAPTWIIVGKDVNPEKIASYESENIAIFQIKRSRLKYRMFYTYSAKNKFFLFSSKVGKQFMQASYKQSISMKL